MKKRERAAFFCCLILATASAVGISAVSVSAQAQVSVSEKVASAINTYYLGGEFEKGTNVAKDLLKQPKLTSTDSVAIYEALSLFTFGQGKSYFEKSIAYLETMAKIGPCVLPVPREPWPTKLSDQWYKITQAKGLLSCSDKSSANIKTVAVMEFDNYSVGKYQTELGLLSKGLADWFAIDFGKLSDLHVVERSKINFVLKEIKLNQSDKVDAATAVKAGKLLGAQFMIFGSITQLDSKHTRMSVRVVKVETSEIVATVDKEGSPDYSKLEKGLVEQLAQKLQITVSDKARGLIQQGGTSSIESQQFYSRGIDAADNYDWKNAYAFFKKAYDADNSFLEAKKRMDIYKPLAG